MTAIQYSNNQEEIDLTEKNNEINQIEQQENSFICSSCGLSYTEESGAYHGFTCEDCLESQDKQDFDIEPVQETSNKETFNLIESIDIVLQAQTDLYKDTQLAIMRKISNKEFDIELIADYDKSSIVRDLLNDIIVIVNKDLKDNYKSIDELSKAQKDALLLYITQNIVRDLDSEKNGINGLLLNRAQADLNYLTINQEHLNTFDQLSKLEVIQLEKPKPVEQEQEEEDKEKSNNELSAFSITWKTKHEFEQVLKTASVLVDELTFEVNGDGLIYRTMDPSHVALIDVFLAQTCFDRFNMPEKVVKFALRIDETLKILQQIENNESLEIKLNEQTSMLEISNKEGFNMKQRLVDSYGGNQPLPKKLTFNSEVTLSEKAINILKKRAGLTEYFTIETTNEFVNFKAKNDMGEFEQKFDYKSEGLAELKTKEDSIATYSVDIMMKFLKSFTSIKPKEFKFEYSSKMPLRIEVPEFARFHFYLAPRIQD